MVVVRDILAGILHSIVAAVLQTVAVLRLLRTWANIRTMESFVEQSFLEVVDMVVERLDMGLAVHRYMVQEAVRLDDRHQEEEGDRHAEIVHLVVAAFPLEAFRMAVLVKLQKHWNYQVLDLYSCPCNIDCDGVTLSFQEPDVSTQRVKRIVEENNDKKLVGESLLLLIKQKGHHVLIKSMHQLQASVLNRRDKSSRANDGRRHATMVIKVDGFL